MSQPVGIMLVSGMQRFRIKSRKKDRRSVKDDTKPLDFAQHPERSDKNIMRSLKVEHNKLMLVFIPVQMQPADEGSF